jgi:peroxiredoxin
MTSAPKRDISKRELDVAINSIAQHASPMGMGHNELLRIQLMAASTLVKMTLPSTFESYATGLLVFIARGTYGKDSADASATSYSRQHIAPAGRIFKNHLRDAQAHVGFRRMKILSAFIASFALLGTALAQPEIGKPAPEFTLKDCSGTEHSLSDFKGKTVVLEWVNHGCPFVVKHYASGNMQKLQEDATGKGVVWLSICSSAPGKQGHMSAADATAKCEEIGSKATAYLLDEDGTAGRLYAAKTTPQMAVINAEGVLVYQGAIDDKASTNQSDIEGATNYVVAALDEVLAGKPVTTAETKPYGCSVKY